MASMGIGKLGKRLDKVARKARETLGGRGKELAVAVLERAISIIESELKSANAAKKKPAPRLRRAKGARSAADADRPAARGGRRRKAGTRQRAEAGEGASRKSASAAGSVAAVAATGAAPQPSEPSGT
jgi:hypothetical protein